MEFDASSREPQGCITTAAKHAEQVILQLDAVDPDEANFGAWARAGLTGLSVRVEGHEDALHVRVARGTEASRRRDTNVSQLREIAEQARAHRLQVHARTQIARSNFRSLEAILDLLVAMGAQSWTLELPALVHDVAPPQGVAHAAPRLALAIPWALKALSRAEKRGLGPALRGVPLCLMGPHTHWAVGPQPPREFAPPCQGCPSRPACPGASSTYLDRFGAGELRVTEAPPPKTRGWWTVANCL